MSNRPIKNRKFISLQALVALLFLPLLALGKDDSNVTFRQAVQAEQDGQLAEAFRHYQTLARAGDDRAQFNLGSFFINGELINQDLTEGLAWIYLSVAGFEDRDEHIPWNRSLALEQLENQIPETRQLAARELARVWQDRFGTGQRKFDPELISLPQLQVSAKTDCSAPTGTHLKRCRGEGTEEDPFLTVIRANGARQPNVNVYGN